MRIALAQINSTVGDLTGNTRKILEWINRRPSRFFGRRAESDVRVGNHR